MSRKRITRAEAQRGMTLIENELRDCDAYAGEVQDRIRAELGSMSIPPQQERDKLENDELRNRHFKEVSEILMTRAKVDAEKCILEEDAFKAAERLTYLKKNELDRLKLIKTDPDLDERQWHVLSDLKAILLEYPALLEGVTGDKTFLEGIKNSYESKLDGYETKLERLIDDVHGLHMTCSDYVETSLETFADRTLKPAINIVKLQHERLETELGEADERSEQREKRIEELEAEVEKAGAEKRRVEDEHRAREESHGQEIAALKKELEDEREVMKDQNDKHKRETTDLKSQLEKARTSAAKQASTFQEELQSSSETVKELKKGKEALEKSVEKWIGRVNTHRQDYDAIKAEQRPREEQLQRAQDQAYSLEESLRAEKEAMLVVKQKAEQEKGSLRNELTAVKEARNSAESQIQSVESQLSTAKTDIDFLKQSSARQVETLQSELSTVKQEKEGREREFQSLQSQLSKVEGEKELLKQSLETEIESLRNQLSTANDASESLVESKHELEIIYGRATETSQSMSRLLQWHISIFDNFNVEGFESDVFCEMGALVDMMERYAGSATEAVSMPKHMPGMTLVGKATELPEPNLVVARHLWMSSRCGSLVLDVAQAFFMQHEISSAQFALLPWIHASLNCAITTMCERSTLTPDLASYLLCILRGLVYTATVAREWSDNHAWIPKVVEMLAKIKDWLGQHVANEASFLMMVADQVNDIVIAHESPSTSISPNLFAEAQRIDSTNSDIPNGMAMVIDNSGMIILFTADDAFVFGASEVKAVEFDNGGTVVFIFEPHLSGLPESLTEIRLHDCGRPEAVKQHERLLETVLPEERLAVVSFRKYLR